MSHMPEAAALYFLWSSPVVRVLQGSVETPFALALIRVRLIAPLFIRKIHENAPVTGDHGMFAFADVVSHTMANELSHGRRG